jgi:hypothetical protein
MFGGLLSPPRHNELAPSEQTRSSYDTKPKDRIRNCKERHHDKKQLTVYQTQNDTHHARAQPHDGGARAIARLTLESLLRIAIVGA